MIQSQWVVIITQAVNLGIVVLGAIDINYHTSLLTNPLTLTIMTILSSLGIHQTMFPSKPKDSLNK